MSAPSAQYMGRKRNSVFAATQLRSKREVQEFKPPVYPKSPEEEAELIAQLKKSFLTKNLNEQQVLVIALAMKKTQKPKGDLICKYGAIGKEYYVLKEGTVQVIVYQDGVKPNDPELENKVLRNKDLGAGIGFGEIALMYGDKRTASILATSDCLLWELEGKVFKNIIMKQVVTRRNVETGYLDKVELFNQLNPYEKVKLLDGLEKISFKKGDTIIKEGDEGDYFYIVEEGDVECYKMQDGAELSVRILSSGAHFGEIALLRDEKRSLSVRANSEIVQALALNREAFNRILGSIDKYLKKDYST